MSEPLEPFDRPTSPVVPNLTDDERLWAMLAHVLGTFGYVITVGQYVGPLILYVMYRDTSRFVAFHALQSLYFQLLLLAIGAGAGVVAFLTCGLGLFVFLPVLAVISVAALIYGVIAAIQAYDGKLFEYPIVGPVARQHVGI